VPQNNPLAVHWRHSISFKLFLLMTVTLLVAIAGISVHNGIRYWEQQKKQSMQEAINEATRSANAASTTIELWSNMLDTMMQENLGPGGATASEIENKIAANLYSNPKFLAISIYTLDARNNVKLLASGFTPHTDSSDFISSEPRGMELNLKAYVGAAAREIGRQYAGKRNEHASYYGVRNIAHQAGTDVIEIRKMFEHPASKVRFAVFLHVWPGSLGSLTKHTQHLRSFVVDKTGKVFLASQRSSLQADSMFSSPSMAIVSQGGVPQSSRTYDDTSGAPIVEVITMVPDSDLFVVVERNNSRELAQITQDIKMTALLSWIFVLLAVMASFLASRAVTRKIIEAVQATLRIAAGDMKIKLNADRKDEVGLLALSVNHMASKIRMLLEVEVEAARQEKELKTAQAVQQTLFKENSKQGEKIVIHGHFEPASECAGDWWFDIKVSDTRQLVIIADATGHGASAALIVALAFSYFKTIGLLLKSEDFSDRSPSRILGDLNTLLVQSGKGRTTMTMFLAELNTDTMVMRYANAGHLAPLLIPADGEDDRLPKKTANPGKRRLMPILGGGSVLGFEADGIFQEHSVSIRRGDRLFFYTDGLIECLGVDGQSMTPMDLRRQLAEVTDSDPNANLCDAIVKIAKQRLGKTARKDDITVVVAEVDPQRGSGAAA
jgi:serine phosphatase RsbU (regulator of sigma subunit)